MSDNGAHFYQCDFQVHSPRDLQWDGAPCVSDEERNAYAATLVQACRAKGLGAIAITDHHDMAFLPYVRRAALEETDSDGNPLPKNQQLIVFPGIELTLAVPCQAILILDADFEENRYSAVLTALAINPSDDDQSKTAETVRLENIHSLKVLKEKLDEHIWLRDRYIILPNVTGEGKFSLLRNGMMAKYKEMPWVGSYVDGQFSALKAGPKSILAGKDKAWGHKRVACIQTSDNRSDKHDKLGCCTSWVKWAKPTAEALRQACLAQESRISHEEPKIPDLIIQSINVSNSYFLGPIDFELNPQYNSLIGGRGTGKSTILEYIRWALCDQTPSPDGEDTPNYQLRRSRLIENTLKPYSATVDVSFLVNGVPHLVRRNSQDGSLQVKIGKDEMRDCAEAEVRLLFPIQAYSQKQLSDVSIRVDELTRFITAPIRSKLSQLDRRIQERADRIRQTYATRRRQKTLAADLAKRSFETRSLEEQAESLRNSLSGLSDDDRALLGQGKNYDAASQLIGSWRGDIKALSDGAENLSRIIKISAATADKFSTLPHPDTISEMHSEYSQLMADSKQILDDLASRAKALNAKADVEGQSNSWAKWQKGLKEFRDEYQNAVRRSSAHSERMDQLRSVEKLLLEHQTETLRVADELKALEAIGDTYTAERKLWHEALAERDSLIDEQCQTLTVTSGGAIRAQVKRYANATSFMDRLREGLSGSGIRRERIEALGASIVEADDPQDRWTGFVEDLEALASFDVANEGVERKPETPTLSSAGFVKGDLEKISRKLSSEDWLTLSLIQIQSEPYFEYRSRENQYIPFHNASSGQQATALLKTLLNQVGPPLLVDQPEEDLDNPVMQEIVEQIWVAKQKRQILFVSHNANLVVNGDAELVAWCDYRKAGDQSGGKIAGEGAIDIPDVRDAIKRIMEGGEAAFKLRREKYGF